MVTKFLKRLSMHILLSKAKDLKKLKCKHAVQSRTTEATKKSDQNWICTLFPAAWQSKKRPWSEYDSKKYMVTSIPKSKEHTGWRFFLNSFHFAARQQATDLASGAVRNVGTRDTRRHVTLLTKDNKKRIVVTRLCRTKS